MAFCVSAARKLGLRLVSSRRCKSTLSESSGDKSLFLCLNELPGDYHQTEGYNVIRRISLADNDKEDEEELGVEAYKKSGFSDWFRKTSSTICSLDSKILYPHFNKYENHDDIRRISWFDTSKSSSKFRVSSPSKEIKSFEIGKQDIKLGVIDGKLYCLNKDFKRNLLSFEVFDHPRWLPLAAPPIVKTDKAWCNHDAVFLNESKKVLCWKSTVCQWKIPNTTDQMYCFDVTDTEKGWTKLDDPGLLNIIPSLYKPLFVHDYHPDLGDFYLVFKHDPRKEALCIHTFFMLNKFDSFQPIINQPAELPELCLLYQNPSTSRVKSQFSMVHLGPRKFGIVINKCNRDSTGAGVLVMFEYNIVVTNLDYSKPDIQITTKLLGTRQFHYRAIKTQTTHIDLTSAFVL